MSQRPLIFIIPIPDPLSSLLLRGRRTDRVVRPYEGPAAHCSFPVIPSQCSHWVVRRSVAEVSRRSRNGGIVLAGGAESRLYTRFFGGRFVGGDAHIAPPRPQARSCLPTPLPMHRVSVPCLSLWERWPSAARAERVNKKAPPVRAALQRVDKPILSFRGAKRRGNP